VRGQVSVSFVDILRQRLSEDRFHLVNAGVNGDLVYNVLKRLDAVLTRKPDFVVILVGTNDVNATLTPRMTQGYRLWKGLPQQPRPEWYRANMLSIIRFLKEETRARIAVTSHPVLGEEMASVANDRIRNYSAILFQLAMQEGITYLPLYERQEEYLRRIGRDSGRPHDADSMLMWTSIFRHYVFRRDFESIARENGFALTTEGLHLNEAGAAIMADLVETFLRDSA